MKTFTAAALLALASFAAQAQSTPVGLWKTIDDETKAEKSLVRISESGGIFSGRIEKLLDPARAGAKCDQCEGERKDMPIAGLLIIKNVKKTEGKDNQWDGGEILDPNNGKTYKLRLTTADDGRKLEVRGYVGAPLLGRTQTWIRVE
ncbi:MAG TPA: DUF2147 domain-containing protein [Methylibium sp.]|uniref:DUF2147 domain-containing protein n=1 Tax=Methylibium sp. TaxID=2067992 RepID=UPI002DBA927B|nr:DUF2147 domain-containing protein [Methylibium sp.]HEU4459000.1 DUF2147 domain-containing protein [Methylibium sp.]